MPNDGTSAKTILPSNQFVTVSWIETICHSGAPWRIALSRDGIDASDSDFDCFLLNHVPHDDSGCAAAVKNVGYHTYYVSIWIPDVYCENCVLQLVNPMTDKISSQSCTYPPGTCFSNYHSCANVAINGNIPRSQLTSCNDASVQTPNWTYSYLPNSTFYKGEKAVWNNGWLASSDAGDSQYVTAAGGVCSTSSNPDNPNGGDYNTMTTSGNICFDNTTGISFCLSWNAIDNDSALEFNLTARTNGWIAIGLAKSETSFMNGADMMIGWNNNINHTFIISDRHSSDYVQPNTNEPQNLTPLQMYYIDGVISLRFTRKLDTGDTVGDNIISLDDDTYMIWAYSSTPPTGANSNNYQANIQIHEEAGAVKINFRSGSNKTLPPSYINIFKLYHGSLMFIAWAVFVPVGIYYARYTKNVKKNWFRFHLAFVTSALICIIVAFGLIVDIAPKHFNSFHAIFGLLILILLLLQLLLGIYANFAYNPSRNQISLFPDMIHWHLGRILFAASVLNVFAGLFLYHAHLGIRLLAAFYYLLLFIFFAKNERSHKKSTPPPAFDNASILLEEQGEEQ